MFRGSRGIQAGHINVRPGLARPAIKVQMSSVCISVLLQLGPVRNNERQRARRRTEQKKKG